MQSNVTDQYVAGPLLSAFKECITGPPEVMNVPSWLYYSFGPVVSIDSTQNPATSGATTGAGRVFVSTCLEKAQINDSIPACQSLLVKIALCYQNSTVQSTPSVSAGPVKALPTS